MTEYVFPAKLSYEGFGKKPPFFDSTRGKEWYQPYTEWSRIPERIYKLPSYYSFNFETIKNDVLKIVEEQGLHPHQNGGYTGIALTAPANLEKYSWWTKQDKDGNEILPNKQFFFPHNFVEEKQPWPAHEFPYDLEQPFMTPAIKKLLARFKSPITKVSIVRLQARGAIIPHLDFPYYRTIRLHTSIVTNPHMSYEFHDSKHKIPADGNFYFLNAGEHHGIINHGYEDRINLSVNLNLDQDMLREHGFVGMIEKCLL